MSTLLDHLKQVSERRRFSGLRMHEEHSRASRTSSRGSVDDLEAILLQVIEGLLNISYTQGNVRQPAAAAVLFQLLRYRRFGAERLQQLDQVGTITYLQQYFTNLVRSKHLFAMDLFEAHCLVCFHMRFEFTGLYRNRDMVKKQKTLYLFYLFTHY